MKQKISLVILLISLFGSTGATYAQRNLYHRLDVGSSNIYTFAVSNILTGYVNYLSHDMLFDNSYVYTIHSVESNGHSINTKPYSPIGLTAHELFNDAFVGFKIGYKSDLTSSFNWGIYASTHYRINQYKIDWENNECYNNERYQYVKPGGGILLTFGSIESQVKVEFEAAARYDLPIGYSGVFDDSKSTLLNKGLSSHYSLKIGGFSSFSIGAFADICHYNIYKAPRTRVKPFSFGLTLTITPKRGEDVLGD